MKLDEEITERTGVSRTTAKNRIREVKAKMGITSRDYSEAVRNQIIHYAVTGDEVHPLMVTADNSFDEIEDYGNIGEANRLTGILQESIAAHALFQKCEGVSGGSEYSARASKYWRWSPAKASERRVIGAAVASGRFSLQKKAGLPPSGKALHALAKLPEQTFMEHVEKGDITPTMTAKQVKAFTAPEKPVEEPVERHVANLEPGRISIIDAFEAERVAVLESLPKGASEQVRRAVEKLSKRLKDVVGESVETVIEDRVKEKVKAERERLNKVSAELEEKKAVVGRHISRLNQVMSEEDFNRIVMALHPDRTPTTPEEFEDYKEKRETALRIFLPLKPSMDRVPKKIREKQGWK